VGEDGRRSAKFNKWRPSGKALALKPDSIDVHRALSFAYFQMDQNEKLAAGASRHPWNLAIEHLNRILEIRSAEGAQGQANRGGFQKGNRANQTPGENRKEQTNLERRQTNYDRKKTTANFRLRQGVYGRSAWPVPRSS